VRFDMRAVQGRSIRRFRRSDYSFVDLLPNAPPAPAVEPTIAARKPATHNMS
jgi:hypothetical protein